MSFLKIPVNCVSNFSIAIWVVACSTTKDGPKDIDLVRAPIYAAESSSTHTSIEPKAVEIGANESIKWQDVFLADNRMDKLAEASRANRNPTATNKDVGTQRTYARTLIQQGMNEEAIAALMDLSREHPTDLNVRLDLAEALLRVKRSDDARLVIKQTENEIAKQVNKQAEVVFRYRFVLSKYLIQSGDTGAGQKILTELISLSPDFVDAYVALAASYLSENKVSIAEFVLKRALDRANQTATAIAMMGWVEKAQGKRDQARTRFAQALEKNESEYMARLGLGNILMENGELEAAELNLSHAVRVRPQDASAWLSLGMCEKAQGRLEKAEQTFKTAIKVNPNDAEARLQLAALYREQLNRPDDAERLYRDSLLLGNEKQKKVAELHLQEFIPQ